MKYYNEESSKVLSALSSTPDGISNDEASKRLFENGKNKLAEGKKVSLIRRFLAQLCDPMIIVLLVAAALSLVTAIYENESLADVFIILFVVILNAVLGVLQESKAEKAIEALKEMTTAKSKVIRGGILMSIPSEDIVVGDIIVLEAGDAVPADARIIECASLKVEEAALTGESVPVIKQSEAIDKGADDTPLGDRKNMLYMGSTVVYGRGKAVVTGCGMNTEMGKIADALTQAQDEATPLQQKLSQLSKILTFAVLGICVLIFAVGIIRAGEFTASSVIGTFMLAISLAVAAIPEGLAAVVTIVLSMGVTKMSKRNAVIRKLTAVETLGCTQVICSDKTGTLTQNKMTVVESYSRDDALLARALALCSDSELDDKDEVIGEPTENALVAFAYKLGLDKRIMKKDSPRVAEAPFDSLRKMMSTVCADKNGYVQYTKGAPDEVLKRCNRIYTENGVRELTDSDRAEILSLNKNMADRALRVLCGAYKEYAEIPEEKAESMECDLVYIGLVGMIDPIREEVKAAIEQCHTAGVRVVMITGDHKDTAIAIANQLGILGEGQEAITGTEVGKMSDEELLLNIHKYSVYARVQPEHKVRIVKAWKTAEKITAMTGDGVNDAPSIKIADIGIGMGITGTDVTKNVADMILADDNFATIVGAVEEGRRIYSNIRKSVQFLLASNLSEVISIFFATMVGFTILKPTHILWINLITDSLPALALGMEDSESDSMKKPPRDSKESIFAGGLISGTIYQGVLVSLLTVLAYLVGHYIESGVWELVTSGEGMTMAFLTLSMAEVFHSFNMRSRHGSIFKIKKQNAVLWGSAALATLLTAAVIYIPFMAKMFEFTPVSAKEYFIAIGIAFSIIPIVELVKLIERFINKKKAMKK
ncbi:MAG: calcium-translocating P-type ATPase, PMCA-type [Clostridia bacterium]|nr:calcium-translocating P-type ATPase, PMCA-type [Clostridia bacterium]